ncbi:hypothetical protein HDU86_005826 [Geranomyces michiganensis]|nr:hypothetical protein HDU86_005826 [Geranomyces michiganensis]
MSGPPHRPGDGTSTSAVREGMQIDENALASYLVPRMPSLVLPLEIKQFEHGQSNPTYFLRDGRGQRYVLRKKPPGALLSQTAHAVEREHRVLRALAEHTAVPVPKVYTLCEDPAVLGTPFYVMEFLEGRIFTDNLIRSVASKDRYAHYHAIVDALAALHAVPYKAVGLADYGPPSGFYPRQLRRLAQVSAAQGRVTDAEDGSAVGPLPSLDYSLEWLAAHAPPDETTLCHGDFKLDNVVFHRTQARVIGMLDWELSTLGHPLSDLANLLLPFYTPMKPFGPMLALMDLPRPLGIPEADELLRQYCARTGRTYPIPGWDFCIAFAFFRLAVITQGVAARVKRKQASSASARQVAKLFGPCADRVAEIASNGLPTAGGPNAPPSKL